MAKMIERVPKKPSLFLRQFPGKRRFERVSREDWEAPSPKADIAGWGHVLRLEADVRVWRPDGELVVAKKWPSRSYIRNFARIMRGIFGSSQPLVDVGGTSRTTALASTPSDARVGLIPPIVLPEGPHVGGQSNGEQSGAGMAVGDGVPAEVHTRNDLVNRVGGIYSARQNLVTTAFNTATTTLQITTGITNAQAVSINVTEIGLYLFADIVSAGTGGGGTFPFRTLLAYDGISTTPVASGGVIAPRYTLDFPV